MLIPRPWIDHPYGEEEITLLEEELLPAMAGFLERVEAEEGSAPLSGVTQVVL